ncbi:MAG: hypothetical protein RR351_03140 [Christensenella sp.]
MNLEFENYLSNPYTNEAAIQNLASGAYIYISDIKKGFQFDRWGKIMSKYASKHDIKWHKLSRLLRWTA